MSNPDRITRLETHITELEHLVDRLNEVVRTQDQQIRSLEKGVQQIVEKLKNLEWDQSAKPIEKPPHYQ